MLQIFFLRWDIKNHTWLITEYLRPLVINVEYMKGGKVLYKSVNFAGYVGILSAIKPVRLKVSSKKKKKWKSLYLVWVGTSKFALSCVENYLCAIKIKVVSLV